jgi:hypothetical protein
MVYSNAPEAQPPLPPDSYVVLGRATCYLRQDGETTELQIIEPIPSAYLETLLTGVPTSYSALYATTLALALEHPKTGLDVGHDQAIHLCEDYTERLQATARSYIQRPSAAQLLRPATTFSELNFSLDSKRILNPRNKVSKSDNVKQHRYTHEVIT